MLSQRGLAFWAALLLIVATTVGSVAFILYAYSRNQESAGMLVGTLVAVITAASSAATWLWTRWRAPGVAQCSLERAADQLAEQLRWDWDQVAAGRQLIEPEPIAVRWRWSRHGVTGPITEALDGRFTPLPGMAAVTVEDLQLGAVKDLLRVYGGLGSGRLIVLGEPSAGKSSAGILLLRDALDRRARMTVEDRTLVRVPVPVLVTPRGWDPNTESFAEWLAARLARDYALLRAPEYGPDAVMRLIRGGYLAVILDGFDEIPEALRPVALQALDQQATFRLLVLTRTEELLTVVRGGQLLRGAAALELLPIEPTQAENYLARSQTDPLPHPWQRLIAHLREHPDDVLAQALNTPLMLTLVRDTCGTEEAVDELLEDSRFATREAVENHLLDRVLTAAYARNSGGSVPYTVDQARQWLGQLARRMKEEETRDLRWWRIPGWVPAWPRAFVTVAVMSAVACLSVFGVSMVTLGKPLGYAFMFGPGLLLLSPPGEGSPQQRDRQRWSRSEIVTILLLGLGVGFGLGLARGLPLESGPGLLFGLVTSFVVGLGFVLGGGPPQQLGGLRWSRTDTRTNLRTGVMVGLVSGLVSGLGYGLLEGFLTEPRNGLRHGLVYGFIVGIGYMLVIVVGGRPSRQWSQLRWGRIDIPTVLLIALVIAIVTGPPCGIIYVLIVVLGGLLLIRSQLRWSRTTTPATLLIALLIALVCGLVYGFVYGLEYAPDYGLILGLIFALVFGLTIGLLLVFRQPPTEAISPLDPPSLWRRERRFGLVFALVFAFVLGLVVGFGDVFGAVLRDGHMAGLNIGPLASGLVAGLGLGLVSSATWATALAGAQLWRRGQAPARLLRFLDDAHERRILRTVGSVYQFRDARLQDRLAATCRPSHSRSLS
ncbi:MAG: hypothetical protein ACRDRA_00040 [Pseudonocardiaceae bacterium]